MARTTRKKKTENNGFSVPEDEKRQMQINAYAVLPGGPGTMDPANVSSQATNGPPGPNKTPYGMNGNTLANGIVQIAPPGFGPGGPLPQSNIPGQKLNYMPYNMQPQPPGEQQPFMEGNYLAMAAQQKGLPAGPMGPVSLGGPMPGSVNPQQTAQDPGTLPLNTMPPEQAAAANGQPGGMNTKTGKRA